MAIRTPLVPADRWLLLAAAFVLGNFALLTALAPPAHRAGLLALAAAWSIAALLLRAAARRYTPQAPAVLLPAALTLSGWGLMGIWRVAPQYGLRQALWLLLASLTAALLLATPNLLPWLRRRAFPLLLGGLVLLVLTFLIGQHPSGAGPRLWLGCCGLYFQPAAFFKVLLALAVAADGRQWQPRLAAVVLAAAALLAAQRDFGTAIFLVALYTAGEACVWQRWQPLAGAAGAAFPLGWAAYRAFPIVGQRMEAWLFPAHSPQHYGYQILQARRALQAGGIAGLGWRSLVPVPLAHSDFIFTTIANGWGLAGALALLVLLAALPFFAFRIGGPLHTFHQRLAAALGLYLGGQTLLILGGNLRLLPLTGMPLPFVAAGGSALFAAFAALAFLLKAGERASLAASSPAIHWCSRLFVLAFTLTAAATAWWMLP
ncbi:MAG TPA: FtsW/RodA/SpoVE family cell cycle protein [Chloroflexi bacterium]|nr:FtsW/RodA/SpoVE family cell cycle protein [Chloroflexota bacterium]